MASTKKSFGHNGEAGGARGTPASMIWGSILRRTAVAFLCLVLAAGTITAQARAAGARPSGRSRIAVRTCSS